MKHNYDTIAPVYDGLARMVFGRTQIRAQLFLLPHIPAGARVLIAGGGTGWVLEEIAAIHASGLTITYVEASAKMAALAAKRSCGANKVTIIALPVEQTSPDAVYDVVLTPFLFDNFTQEHAERIFAHINDRMADKSVWLYCDFCKTSVWWQRLLLKTMYAFFRLFCGVEGTGMPDAQHCFSLHRYRIAAQQYFMRGFITSAIYKRG